MASDASCHIIASGNRSHSDSPVLIEMADNVEPLLSGHGNIGFAVNLVSASSANSIGEILRAGLIGGSTGDGHALATAQTVTLADDASHTFAPVGTYGIGIITNNFGDTTQAIFAHDSASANALITSSDISVGSGTSNPDMDGDLNIWLDGAAVNIWGSR